MYARETEQALMDNGGESARDYALNSPVHYALLAGGADGLECVRILAAHGALSQGTASLSLSSPEHLCKELGNSAALALNPRPQT